MRLAIVALGLLLSALLLASNALRPETSQVHESATMHEEYPASSTSSPTSRPRDNLRAYEWYKVVKVIDGDTLVAAMDGQNVTVRLIGIDTPETVDPRKTVQCFGKEASAKARELLAGRYVRLETDPSQGELDKYGRLLAYAFLENDVSVAEHLIAEGYGHEYTYNIPYKYQSEFKAAEDRARIEKWGLWADDACTNERFTKPLIMPVPGTGVNAYECSHNTYNCSNFSTQAEAQTVFDSCGGSGNDIHKLDSHGDGEICESLP